jgi:ABC-type branched-subunit amino acid transport system ATPase component
VLEIEDLRITFGEVRAVDGISLSVSAGESIGLIGPNGSGKSTMVNAITGVIRGRGRVSVDGRSVRMGSPRSAARCGISRTFQTPQTFLQLTCMENVLLGLERSYLNGLTGAWFLHWQATLADKRRAAIAMSLLERCGLASLAQRPASALSYGQQRMLELARSLATEPAILILDEPAAGLNHAETGALADLLADVSRNGTTVFLVEHKMDFVRRLCPRIAVLSTGTLIADGPAAAVFSDPIVIDAYLGPAHARG